MTGRLLGLLAGAAIVAGVAASTARADGLPVLGVDVGSKGVTVPGATARYVTLWSGKKSTVVARVRRNGGRIDRSRLLQGTFTIPAVAYDGSASGLSADGSVLVLIQPRRLVPAGANVVRRPRRPAPAAPQGASAARRLQLRRDLTERKPDLPDQLPLAKGCDEVRGPGLRRASRPPASRAGRRPKRGRRADARPADLAGDEPRRALGVHALRRQRQDAVRPCARHEPGHRAVHRPRRAGGNHVPLAPAPHRPRRREAHLPSATGARRSSSSARRRSR